MSAVVQAARSAAEGVKLVNHFREQGHLWARLDPLERCLGPLSRHPDWWREEKKDVVTSLKLQTCAEDRIFLENGSIYSSKGPWWDRHELLEFLRKAYCDTISVEAAHIVRLDQREWWYRAAEQQRSLWAPGPAHQRQLLLKLSRATQASKFLRARFPASKWFGLDGNEALTTGLFRLCCRSGQLGVESIHLGMSHRGRLNILWNLFGKPMGEICAEMRENRSDFYVGDVKYHLGFDGILKQPQMPQQLQKDHLDINVESVPPVALHTMPNPSHLEVVGPAVVGKVRALQDIRGGGQEACLKTMGVVVHGDAALSISGASFETMQLAELPGYSTGGTIHVVLNNQIGFTTEPHFARSSSHPSDVAKALGVPVVHVNADDIEAVDRAFELAADWRFEFGRDVIVDLVGYRRFGHNETDVPETIHPRTYARIRDHPEVCERYAHKLVEAGTFSEDEVAFMNKDILDRLELEFNRKEEHKQDAGHWLHHNYRGRLELGLTKREAQKTGVPIETLCRIGTAACTLPEGFTVHPEVDNFFKNRLKMIRPGGRVDFATAEMLAFSSMLLHRDIWVPEQKEAGCWEVAPHETLPCVNVRLTGQDSNRGTFSQRNLYVQDVNGVNWNPLKTLAPGHQANFNSYDSPLSELAVLAFEYGYSVGDPASLVCWEAQFGDFANCAQVVIDQFIASGEEKWGQPSDLTLLLPHGYDGQGPDHSSARLERFLSLVNDDPDYLPGASPQDIRHIERAFDILDVDRSGTLSEKEVIEYIGSTDNMVSGEFHTPWEAWKEVTAECNANWREIDRASWLRIMQRLYRRNSEVNANIFVVNASTPANLYHVLRRQAHRKFKKPLVVMTPKYLLHHTKATSAIEDLGAGSFFRRVILDYNPLSDQESGLGDNTRHLAVTKSGNPATVPLENIRRLIICSGQIYYALSHFRRARKIKDVVILRLEQIAPFPHDLITQAISFYPNADVVWCQEEPKNMGAWFYVQPRLATALQHKVEIQYIGRSASAATATGSPSIHRQQIKVVLEEAFAI